jgi:mono/diheme cytochrome c family protein
MRALALALSLAAAPPAAWALGGQNPVLGRMVAARPDAPSVAAVATPRLQYVLHCAGCHGLDGAGAPAAYVPDLRRLGAWLRVEGGRDYVMKVPGMRGSGLDDAQLAAVANWMLEHLARDSLPPAHQPFRPDELRRARAEPLVDVAGERRRLLERARAQGIAID